jgi:hypothetical protein
VGRRATISIPDGFILDNADMAKSGRFVYRVRGGIGTGYQWVIWEIDGMNISVCSEGVVDITRWATPASSVRLA